MSDLEQYAWMRHPQHGYQLVPLGFADTQPIARYPVRLTVPFRPRSWWRRVLRLA